MCRPLFHLQPPPSPQPLHISGTTPRPGRRGSSCRTRTATGTTTTRRRTRHRGMLPRTGTKYRAPLSTNTLGRAGARSLESSEGSQKAAGSKKAVGHVQPQRDNTARTPSCCMFSIKYKPNFAFICSIRSVFPFPPFLELISRCGIRCLPSPHLILRQCSKVSDSMHLLKSIVNLLTCVSALTSSPAPPPAPSVGPPPAAR